MTLADKALRYWHTLQHLKPVQLYGRLWFRFHKPGLPTRPAPGFRPHGQGWQTPAAKPVSMLSLDSFCFVNRTQRLPAQGGWNDAALDKLWLYNLHYFDDLNAVGASQRHGWHQALMQRWVAENPPIVGNGWEPYPTSLRIINWVKWALVGNVLPASCRESLATQARWLAKRLEWHLLGNHLFANAKALVFAGLFFQGKEADVWLQTGLSLIARELPEQMLPDGGHFERSTMYHAIFLEDVLDLINAANAWSGRIDPELVAQWRLATIRMLEWLLNMAHPDGQIGLFNDAAFGIAPEPEALRAYAQRLGIKAESPPPVPFLALQHWKDSGYIRLSSEKAVALLDVAPVGPDYLPGHAHADTLSFELSLFGQRVVVNGGTSRYGLGPERLRERETAAHSTVEVAGESSSEVWSGFRVARRAYPFDLQTAKQQGQLTVTCSHDGYKRLPGRPVHRREWVMDVTGLQVSDQVTEAQHAAVARYILHPAVHIFAMSGSSWQLTLPGGQKLRIEVLAGQGGIEPACYAPEFGKVLPTQCLAVALVAGLAMTKLMWS